MLRPILILLVMSLVGCSKPPEPPAVQTADNEQVQNRGANKEN